MDAAEIIAPKAKNEPWFRAVILWQGTDLDHFHFES